jgi:hypothetical protein
MTQPPPAAPDAANKSTPPTNEGCEYIPHPDGIHEMIIKVSRAETVDEMLLKFNVMYETTRHEDRQLILIFDQTKTGLPFMALFPRLRAWLRQHPMHPNPRVAVLFGYNNLIGTLAGFLSSIGISPRRITMWKPNQREQAIAWLLADHPKQ